jgi:hypothetical protein
MQRGLAFRIWHAAIANSFQSSPSFLHSTGLRAIGLWSDHQQLRWFSGEGHDAGGASVATSSPVEEQPKPKRRGRPPKQKAVPSPAAAVGKGASTTAASYASGTAEQAALPAADISPEVEVASLPVSPSTSKEANDLAQADREASQVQAWHLSGQPSSSGSTLAQATAPTSAPAAPKAAGPRKKSKAGGDGSFAATAVNAPHRVVTSEEIERQLREILDPERWVKCVLGCTYMEETGEAKSYFSNCNTAFKGTWGVCPSHPFTHVQALAQWHARHDPPPLDRPAHIL